MPTNPTDDVIEHAERMADALEREDPPYGVVNTLRALAEALRTARADTRRLEAQGRCLRSIERIHFRDANDPNFCSACGTSWPCLTRDALAERAAIAAEEE